MLTAGSYEAQVYYTCKKENIGVTLELSFNRNKTRGRIEKKHDPPLLGEAENRVPRGESLVKDFRPETLGTLNLPAERGMLTLRATDIPGSEAVDVRYIVLTRLGK